MAWVGNLGWGSGGCGGFVWWFFPFLSSRLLLSPSLSFAVRFAWPIPRLPTDPCLFDWLIQPSHGSRAYKSIPAAQHPMIRSSHFPQCFQLHVPWIDERSHGSSGASDSIPADQHPMIRLSMTCVERGLLYYFFSIPADHSCFFFFLSRLAFFSDAWSTACPID